MAHPTRELAELLGLGEDASDEAVARKAMAEIERMQSGRPGENHDQCPLRAAHDVVPYSSACGTRIVKQAVAKLQVDVKDAKAKHKEALDIAERYIKRLHEAEDERDLLWGHASDRVDWHDGEPEVAKLADQLTKRLG